jgi:hypothetical protein
MAFINFDFARRPHRCRLCRFDFHGVDVRHATRSASKDIIDIKVPKSRRSNEPHNSTAAWATRRPWRVFTRMFVAHVTRPDEKPIGKFVSKTLRWRPKPSLREINPARRGNSVPDFGVACRDTNWGVVGGPPRLETNYQVTRLHALKTKRDS